MDELLNPRHLTHKPQLNKTNNPQQHHQALPVDKNLLREPLEEQRPNRSRADDAHVPAQHVPELKQLVELRGAQEPADAGLLRLGQPRQLLAVEGADPHLGLRLERAKLDHREDLPATADARTAIEHTATAAKPNRKRA